MKNFLIAIFASFLLQIIVFGQGTVRGKITDENGEPLTGVAIAIRSLGLIAFSDFEGKYSLKIPASGSQLITYSFVGYQNVEDSVMVSKNEIMILDYNLIPVTTSLSEVVVTGKAKKANDTYMELLKAKSAVSIDYISAETIKKTGDSQTTDAIKRITGVSTVGGFISVRGLADRYIKTAVNGLRIPTLDPLTNNIKLDMFPTSLVDNIIISKTFSPDLPGDWAGSYVSIETKDYPEKLSVSINTTLGYNNQTTFHNIVSSKRSSTDLLGYDDGYRDMYRTGYDGSYPQIKGTSDSPITPYEELSVLGLTDYMDKMGFTKENLSQGSLPSSGSSPEKTIAFRLCLVELGLLSPGEIDVQEKIKAAEEKYKSEYREDAIKKINTPASEFGQSLPNNWGTIKRKAPLSFTQEFSIGDQVQLFNRPIGFLLGFRYNSSTKYDPSAEFNISTAPESDSLKNVKSQYYNHKKQFATSSETFSWSALANIAYAFSRNHNISIMFMPNFTGTNIARQGSAKALIGNSGGPDTLKQYMDQYYEERRQLIYQVSSMHYFPVPNLRVSFNLSYTDGSSSIPDTKNFSMYDLGDHLEYAASESFPEKRSAYLSEMVLDSRVSAEIGLDDKPGLVRKLKFGGAYQLNTRIADIYKFEMKNDGSFNINDLSEVNEQYTKDKFDINNGSYLYYAYEKKQTKNFSIGESKIWAYYLMLDYSINRAIRCSGGLRLEYTDMFGDIRLYYEKGLAPDDPERLSTTVVGAMKSGQPGNIKRYNYLPCISLIYQLKSNETGTINTRLNYSRTIARPSIREITNLYQVDFILDKEILGNPKLKIVEIDNYDLRFEAFFAEGNNISISFFYKNFKNHIELLQVDVTTWRNAEFAEAYGIELEGQKQLIWNFNLKANLTLIRSNSKTKYYEKELKHDLFGQSPYIINAILDYKLDKWGLSVALSYNVQGKKLALLSVPKNDVEYSHIYEMPQHLVDFKLSKSLGKHFSTSFKIRNILNEPVRRSYEYTHVGFIDYDNYTYGTDYSLGLSYNF